MKYYIILSAALAISAVNASAQTKRSTKILDRQVAVENIKATRADDQFFVGMDLRLDSLRMPANRRIVLRRLSSRERTAWLCSPSSSTARDRRLCTTEGTPSNIPVLMT